MTGRPHGEDVRSPQRPPVASWVSLTFPMCHDFLSFLPTADVSEGCLNYCGTPKEVAVPFVSRPRLALLPCGVSRSWGSQLGGHRQRGQNWRRGDTNGDPEKVWPALSGPRSEQFPVVKEERTDDVACARWPEAGRRGERWREQCPLAARPGLTSLQAKGSRSLAGALVPRPRRPGLTRDWSRRPDGSAAPMPPSWALRPCIPKHLDKATHWRPARHGVVADGGPASRRPHSRVTPSAGARPTCSCCRRWHGAEAPLLPARSRLPPGL